VSAKGRSLPNENYVPFIQTDVAINPGNSGGPLFNLKGEVVGVNSQIFSRTGGYMGLSFAIPIKVAINVVEQLKTKGKVSRGWLGVYIQNVTQKLAKSFGLDRPRGALVSRVLKASPAEKAGIKVGDIIIEFGGQEIQTSSQLPPIVGQYPAGSRARVKVIRGGKNVILSVRIGELKDLPASKVEKKAPDEQSLIRELNIKVRELNSQQRKKLGLSEKAGILVTRVMPGPARNASLQEGDIILKLGQKEIGGISELRKALRSLKAGKTLPLLIYRDGSPLYLPLTLSE
jgi:serine protease Do